MAVSKVDAANQIENQLPQANIAGNVNFRNIIINGDFSQAQRATSITGITGGNYYTVDRFRINISSMGTWTMSQSTDVPSGQGFSNSLKMDCTTADASPSASDVVLLQTRFEGQNLQYLKKGTSSAESLTLSFWVKSSKTGTYITSIKDQDNTRNISKSYTIDTADTWEKKIITYAGDTTGTLDNDNNGSLYLNFWLGAGTNYTSGTLATSWESATDANQAVGQVNLADSTDNEWYITGVQLEAGTTASDFEFLPYDVNLRRCQRYFQTIDTDRANTTVYVVGADGSNQATAVFPLIVPLRAGFSHSGGSGTLTKVANMNIGGFASSSNNVTSFPFYSTANGFISIGLAGATISTNESKFMTLSNGVNIQINDEL